MSRLADAAPLDLCRDAAAHVHGVGDGEPDHGGGDVSEQPRRDAANRRHEHDGAAQQVLSRSTARRCRFRCATFLCI